MNSIDLFAGAGGMSYGFELENFNTVLGIEEEESFCKTFRYNIPAVCLNEDLTKIEPSSIPVSKNQVDLVLGGPPCQDFSVANYYSRGGEKTNLVFVFSKWVEYFDPEVFVMENVSGIKSVGNIFKELKQEFKKLGYNLSYNIINSANCDVPQERKRMIIIGSKKYSFDLSYNSEKTKTVRDAFKNLPKVKSGEKDDSVNNHKAPNHKQKTIKRIKNTEYGEELFDSWSEKIRLNPNKPSPTLKAGKRANYHFAHPKDNRGLTIRERARLQSFPDSFLFKGTMTEKRTQTGNAVPVKLARTVAKTIKNKYNI
jgi:DNA (cytosine-5)-methyltransferase 1